MNVDVSFTENALINAIRRVTEATKTKFEADREYRAAVTELHQAITAEKSIEGLVLLRNIPPEAA